MNAALKQPVQDQLTAAAARGGWSHSVEDLWDGPADVFRRGLWELEVYWSKGGRIAGAGLREYYNDEAARERPMQIRHGQPVRPSIYRFGMVSGEPRKREHLIELLLAPSDGMADAINAVNEDRRC